MLLARVCAQPERRSVVLFLFSVAVGSRIIAFAAPPLLSDDLHRYLWDGKLLASGINPYDYRPLDPALQPFQDEHFDRLNSRHWYSVYPPLMQVLFGISWKVFGDSLSGWKFIAIVADIISLLLLWKLLSEWNCPRATFLYYAWNPLVIWEAVGNGHSEVVAVCFMLLALLTWRRHRAASGACWGLSILAKLLPALGLVWIFTRSRRAGWMAVMTSLAGILLVLRPRNVSHFFESLTLYPKFFAFNSLVYRIALQISRALGLYWDNKIGFGMLALFLASFLLISWRTVAADPRNRGKIPSRTPMEVSSPDGDSDVSPLQFIRFLQFAFTLYWILSPVGHPWYFLMLAWTMAPIPRASLLWLNAALPFSYSAYRVSPPRDLTVVLCLEYIPFVLLWLWELRKGEWRMTANDSPYTTMN